MDNKQYYAKSFEEDFVLKTLKGKRKVNFQSIEDILKKNVIKPNTKSFGREMRLACTFLHKNYSKTYRPQGLIFKIEQKPDFVYPFDLVALSDAEKIIVQYYRIKNNLHTYYNHSLLKGFERFVFKNPTLLLKEFPTLKKVWTELNKFRVAAGYRPLSKQKHKLIEYNEVIFHKPLKVRPVAVFGYKKIARDIARKYNLPHFVSAKKFHESLS